MLCSDLVKHTQKNYRLPEKLSYDGVTYYILEYAYIVSYGVYHLKSDFTIPNFEWKSNDGEDVNIRATEQEYKDAAKRVYNFIVKNGAVPTYVTIKGKKVPIKLYIYSLATVIQYYHNHQRLPDTCVFDYNVFIKPQPKPVHKKYGHSNEPCCDDRGQNTPHYCACHSLQEVFRNLTNIVVPQSTIARWCGTTENGTGHSGMDTGVAQFNREYNQNLKVQWRNFSELGWSGIKDIINSNDKDCIIHNWYRRGSDNGGGHYEVINGIDGNTVIVQNSLGNRCSHNCYYGYVEYRSKSTFEYYINGISQKSVMVVTNAK